MSSDVLEEAPLEVWAEFSDDPGEVIPEPALVFCSKSLACEAFPLAWVSPDKGVDRSGKGLCIKGGDVVPYWGWREVSCALGCDDG